ncbi:MAG: MGMT family protein [Myxococcales bacterium]|nr:MGMT family protein [Myxococcales bacterium]
MGQRGLFDRAVARVVRAIPRGSTLSYGAVAAVAGRPGAARAVVRALYRVRGLPWWRVIRSDGTLAPEVAPEQAGRLRSEGVKLSGARSRRADGGVAVVRVEERRALPRAGKASIGRRSGGP